MSNILDWSRTTGGDDEWGDFDGTPNKTETVNDDWAIDNKETTNGEVSFDMEEFSWNSSNGNNGASVVEDTSDIKEKFKWAQTPVKTMTNYNGPIDKVVIAEALSKLTPKAFKEMAKVLDETEYDAFCVIMDAVGFKDEFINETQGSSTHTIATPIMDECLNQINDVMVACNAIKHPMYYKLQKLALERVNGGKPKSSEIYELITELVKFEILVPEQICTDASKMHLALCMNKAKEYNKTQGNDFGGNDWDFGGNSSSFDDWNFGGNSNSNDDWNFNTPSSKSSGGYNWDDEWSKPDNSSGGSVFGGGYSSGRRNQGYSKNNDEVLLDI